jgi:hypothetical protein
MRHPELNELKTIGFQTIFSFFVCAFIGAGYGLIYGEVVASAWAHQILDSLDVEPLTVILLTFFAVASASQIGQHKLSPALFRLAIGPVQSAISTLAGIGFGFVFGLAGAAVLKAQCLTSCHGDLSKAAELLWLAPVISAALLAIIAFITGVAKLGRVVK